MASEPKTIEVAPGGELDRILDEAGGAPLRLVRGGERFRLDREADEDDIWADYDPERARAGIRAAAGAWTDIDGESLKEYIYRAREEGTRPPDRP
jgi:hypothetical protein